MLAGLQPVQSSSGVAVAQPIAGGGNNMESVQQMASQAAWNTGRHIKHMGEAGFKLLSTQVSTASLSSFYDDRQEAGPIWEHGKPAYLDQGTEILTP